MADVADPEALEWLEAYLRSPDARNPRPRPGVYRVDPKYALPFVAHEYGVEGDEADPSNRRRR